MATKHWFDNILSGLQEEHVDCQSQSARASPATRAPERRKTALIETHIFYKGTLFVDQGLEIVQCDSVGVWSNDMLMW